MRAQLDAPAGEPDDASGWVDRRKRLWAEHDELLAQIRRHSGFAQFLRPPRLLELRPAVRGGAALLVNAGQQGGHAIILTAGAEPVLVALPDLTSAAVLSQTIALLEATHSNGLAGTLRKQRVLPEILTWLWDAATGPVLDVLASHVDGESVLPRVWWLPLGLLGLFPLHAAGRPGGPSTLDRVVSSYTSTLRMLAHTRGRPPVNVRRQLVVALEHTPGLPDLPGTVAEAVGQRTDTAPLVDHEATTGNVLTALAEHTWAHFAYHASADASAPSRSPLCQDRVRHPV